MLFQTLSIVGVGLIGGSIGLASRRRGIAGRVIGVGRQLATLEIAHHLHIIDSFTTNLIDGIRDADLIVFCTPVDRIPEQIREVAAHCKSGAIITDAGSTKAHIVAEVERLTLPKDVHFVGSHPLAGSEKRGPEHARANLFENRLAVVTPTPSTDAQALEKTLAFWKALGSKTCTIDAETHDRALGLTSHLPHAVSAALAAVLPPEWRPFAATGFRDTTRLAAGDAALWTAIFRDNRAAVLAALEKFDEVMNEFRTAMEHDDEQSLMRFLIHAKENRDALGT